MQKFVKDKKHEGERAIERASERESERERERDRERESERERAVGGERVKQYDAATCRITLRIHLVPGTSAAWGCGEHRLRVKRSMVGIVRHNHHVGFMY